MFRFIAVAAVLSVTVMPAYAAPCRDGHGKFVKCPTKAPAKPKQCRDAKGHFKKC
ncbi:hypothetical protein SPAN111604_09460 [Sphingomonas antarctica]